MKKLILFLILMVGFTLGTVNAQVSSIKFPAGAATVLTSTTDTATLTITPKNTVEFMSIDSTTLDAALTVNVVTTYAKPGYILYLQAISDGTNRVLTFGTGMRGTALTVTARKRFMIMCVYDGTSYVVATRQQEN